MAVLVSAAMAEAAQGVKWPQAIVRASQGSLPPAGTLSVTAGTQPTALRIDMPRTWRIPEQRVARVAELNKLSTSRTQAVALAADEDRVRVRVRDRRKAKVRHRDQAEDRARGATLPHATMAGMEELAAGRADSKVRHVSQIVAAVRTAVRSLMVPSEQIVLAAAVVTRSMPIRCGTTSVAVSEPVWPASMVTTTA